MSRRHRRNVSGGAERVEGERGRPLCRRRRDPLPGNMLMRGLSIEEIARSLRRDQREVRDKVAEVGRACR